MGFCDLPLSSVNELLERGWVETRPNPAHRRSALVSLSPAGRERLAAAQTVEEKLVVEVGCRFDAEDLAITARTLAALEHFFDTPEWAAVRRRHLDMGDA